jgi:hypothetical protein
MYPTVYKRVNTRQPPLSSSVPSSAGVSDGAGVGEGSGVGGSPSGWPAVIMPPIEVGWKSQRNV